MCARAKVDLVRDEVGETASRVEDWARVEDLAYRHGLTSLLNHHLSAASYSSVPPDVRSRLQQDHSANVRLSMVQTGELLGVLELLEASEIQPLAYKGQAVSSLLYDPPSLRVAADIDLLVRPADVATAHATLVRNGYAPSAVLSQAQKRKLVAASSSFVFLSPHSGTIIDLNWGLVPPCFSFSLPVEEFWPRQMSFMLQGRPIPTPAPEDLLAALCIHGSKHLWEMAKWLCDVAELIREFPEVDFDRILAAAAKGGYRRPLLLGLALAADLLDAPVPESVRAAARQNAAVNRLEERTCARMFSDTRALRAKSRWEIQLEDSPRRQIRYALHRLFAPEQEDWLDQRGRAGALSALARPAKRLAPLLRKDTRP